MSCYEALVAAALLAIDLDSFRFLLHLFVFCTFRVVTLSRQIRSTFIWSAMDEEEKLQVLSQGVKFGKRRRFLRRLGPRLVKGRQCGIERAQRIQ
jgi:hypothetical protein